ncbi:hypothetical protein VNI00_006042 [Paramarasmius palmivorus]|uniref:Protein kinase domain-containing protein n=1 Tax=Paramarasmius palmivorus TaxID=297713 RepID=A0AAW0DB35_9AGAR
MNHEADSHSLQLLMREDEKQYQELLDERGDRAQSWLDWLQQYLGSEVRLNNVQPSKSMPQEFRVVYALQYRSELAPSCLTIRGLTKLGDHPVHGGGFGDIWRGRLDGMDDQFVCLKVVKPYLMSNVEANMKDYLREAIVWRQLKHPNLLPCLGLYHLDDSRDQVCLVSPWIEKGNLVNFLQGYPLESVDHIQLMYDITSGLSHLHSLKIVHGDLKAANVLITGSHRACIADFGFSCVADSQVFKVTSTATHTTGLARWCALEILSGGVPTTRSDVYSAGCLYYEIVTGNPVFYDLSNEAALIAVLQKKRPSKPPNTSIPDMLWSLIDQCLQAEPVSRPTTEDLLQRLLTFGVTHPAQDWNSTLFTEFQRRIANDPFEGVSGTPRVPVELMQSLRTWAGNGDVLTAPHADHAAKAQPLLKPVMPLRVTASRRRGRKTLSAVDVANPWIIDRKVRALLKKFTADKFDSISGQIIGMVNNSENEKDGRTLIQVIRHVFENAIDSEPDFSEMYARLCRKMMEQISPRVRDEGIRNPEGKPISGGQLFRKYLLNRCQEDFERGWEAKETRAVTKAVEDKSMNTDKEEGENSDNRKVALYPDENYTAQKLLSNVENPQEEEIESLCTLLTTVGQVLDTAQAKAHMDVYFSRMKELTRSAKVRPQMQSMLQDVIELREQGWAARNVVGKSKEAKCKSLSSSMDVAPAEASKSRSSRMSSHRASVIGHRTGKPRHKEFVLQSRLKPLEVDTGRAPELESNCDEGR